ncbi:MAG: T9SS type A sorting domain-containing protein, partial [Ignavibacteria bacterium]|nr:T9SS type A sorting domain-containing protein [Ignavibacteria bacterium]
ALNSSAQTDISTDNNFVIESIKIFPNPSHGDFQIQTITNSPDREASLYVLNILGQIVFTQKLDADKDGIIKQTLHINKTIPEGLYFIKIEDDFTKHDIIRLKIE